MLRSVLFSNRNVTKSNKSKPKNPYSLLTFDLESHNYQECSDENCIECNRMADDILSKMKERTFKNGGVRLPKFEINRLKRYFGEKITRKAISRYSQNEIYKRNHYNIIPCSCSTKKHSECGGTWHDRMSIVHACKCKRHSRAEKKEFEKWEGVQCV